VLTVLSLTALASLFALVMVCVRVFPASASRDGLDSTVVLRDARWFPTALDMDIASRANASVRRDGRETFATLRLLAQVIATTEDFVSRESAIAEVDMEVSRASWNSAPATALAMVRV